MRHNKNTFWNLKMTLSYAYCDVPCRLGQEREKNFNKEQKQREIIAVSCVWQSNTHYLVHIHAWDIYVLLYTVSHALTRSTLLLRGFWGDSSVGSFLFLFPLFSSLTEQTWFLKVIICLSSQLKKANMTKIITLSTWDKIVTKENGFLKHNYNLLILR